MFDKKVERTINNNEAMSLYGLIDNELERCWEMLDYFYNKPGEANESNVKSVYSKITTLHEHIEKLVEKSPDIDIHKTIKDLQEHMAERVLLEEQIGKEE